MCPLPISFNNNVNIFTFGCFQRSQLYNVEKEQRGRPSSSSLLFGGVTLKELVHRSHLAGAISWEPVQRSYLAGASLQTGILRALWWERRAVRVKAWLPSVRKIYGQPMKPVRKILGRSNEISEKKIRTKNVLRNKWHERRAGFEYWRPLPTRLRHLPYDCLPGFLLFSVIKIFREI